MSKFKPNDPVWVRSFEAEAHDDIPAGEHAGVVVEECAMYQCAMYQCFLGYIVILCQNHSRIIAGEHRLRPRRDDYQQHEPLGSRADLDKPLKTREPSLEDLAEAAFQVTQRLLR